MGFNNHNDIDKIDLNNKPQNMIMRLIIKRGNPH